MILDLFSSLLGVFVGDDGEYKSIFLSACQLYRSGRRVKTSRDSYYYVHKTHTSEQTVQINEYMNSSLVKMQCSN